MVAIDTTLVLSDTYTCTLLSMHTHVISARRSFSFDISGKTWISAKTPINYPTNHHKVLKRQILDVNKIFGILDIACIGD